MTDNRSAETTEMTKRERILGNIFEESGLRSLSVSPRDVKLLCVQRFVRMLAYGVSTLILVAYLDALGAGKTKIGLFMTLTLVGDLCISFFLTLFADALGRKAILAFGALLMTVSGMVFAFSGSYWALLAAAVIGVISPNGNEIGPFRAIEESIVAQMTQRDHRSDVYAWYSLSGLAGASCGFLLCGWVLQCFTETLKWDLLYSYRIIYLIYAAFGLLKLALTLFLTASVESATKRRDPRQGNEEAAPLLGNDTGAQPGDRPSPMRRLRAILPKISRESASTIATLCLLFFMDSFGTGLSPLSWITYYFQWRFHVEEGKLGTIFSITQMLAAISMIVASSIAKRLGNVKTMVLTHFPSQVFRALIGIPDNVYVALLFCFINASTSAMDTGPRSAFLATIILPEERTAVMGTLNVVKTMASSIGPIIMGVLVDHDLYWVAFVASGSLKALYDLGLLAFFKNKEKEREHAEHQRVLEEEESNITTDHSAESTVSVS
ncbi:major facilitator superfamily domain-containing protein [Xylariaceae sp. FL0016]|nr:major facilitator superfamily domain-containing protein [Xylariaceae sp. FL0016]